MTPVADNSLNHAAAFVRGLAPDAAAAMLGRLSAEEAGLLRAAIARLQAEEHKESVETDEPAFNSRPASPVSSDGSVELQLSSHAPTFQVPAAAPAPTPTPPSPLDGAAWLRQLRDADPRAIAEYLSREQPRAIAVVIRYLPPELGAGVLQCLPAPEQSKVVAQLAEQDDADPDSLRVIAAGLSDWVDRKRDEHQRRATRVATIRQIFAATPESQRGPLLRSLAESEPEIAASLADLAPEPPKPVAAESTTPRRPAPQPERPAPTPQLSLDDLQRVDGRLLAEALGTLESRQALLALAAAPEAIVGRLASGLPRGASRALYARIHQVGPTTLAEIDAAQNRLLLAVEAMVNRRRAARLTQQTGA
ncbi:Flagellar motor switch protein FliG [Botrimarina colliarenosi]|uniref:Flagellar motor switch protein FliG n=1 Tax=Botrimarina colliarenosi TaxID=2528001 RepID=A0A5C6AMV1_9BACT|nr:FliG C-terminal domain-containing protein [Botrimarina colliarenosi]TWU00332.1 Flagellar motor switch protein FliG [Botrimarina colliarenosi]